MIFGVNSSQFLAILAVQAGAKKNLELFPRAVQEIYKTWMWVTSQQGLIKWTPLWNLKQDISEIMMIVLFTLTKWACNGRS